MPQLLWHSCTIRQCFLLERILGDGYPEELPQIVEHAH